MVSFNRGEWSELYGILFLLVKPNIELVDSSFEKIEETDIFTLEKIIMDSKIKLEYEIKDDLIYIYVSDKQERVFTKNEVEEHRILLLEKILSAPSKEGSFQIPVIEDFLDKLSNGNVIKGKSKDKFDMTTIVYDGIKDTKFKLNYSIKSSLGSPPTILNASKHTNFKYRIYNITDHQVKEINNIKTKSKLLDRINKIIELGGKIEFEEVPSDSMNYNLKLIDSKLPEYLGKALLYSYLKNNKILKEVFLKANIFDDEEYGIKKLSDLMEGISFGFVPSVKWDGVNSVNGGLVIVKQDGDVVVLDLVYFKQEVSKYLLDNTKLDSPSTTRYHMLEIQKDTFGYYFTLNLQIRYIR